MRYNHYRKLKNLKKKSKVEKVVILILIILCAYFPAYSILSKSKHIEVHAVESVQASESEVIDICASSVVDCPEEVLDAKNDPIEEVSIRQGDVSPIIKKIENVFGSDSRIAIAVFKSESGLNVRSMNWNCRYNGVSQSCRPEDRDKAWSVDCGLVQKNVIGQTCPEELFDADHSLRIAKEMFDRRGFQPWFGFTNGSHIKFLK